MINWSLLSPRNIFALSVMGLLAYAAFNYFSKKGE